MKKSGNYLKLLLLILLFFFQFARANTVERVTLQVPNFNCQIVVLVLYDNDHDFVALLTILDIILPNDFGHGFGLGNNNNGSSSEVTTLSSDDDDDVIHAVYVKIDVAFNFMRFSYNYLFLRKFLPLLSIF